MTEHERLMLRRHLDCARRIYIARRDRITEEKDASIYDFYDGLVKDCRDTINLLQQDKINYVR